MGTHWEEAQKDPVAHSEVISAVLMSGLDSTRRQEAQTANLSRSRCGHSLLTQHRLSTTLFGRTALNGFSFQEPSVSSVSSSVDIWGHSSFVRSLVSMVGWPKRRASEAHQNILIPARTINTLSAHLLRHSFLVLTVHFSTLTASKNSQKDRQQVSSPEISLPQAAVVCSRDLLETTLTPSNQLAISDLRQGLSSAGRQEDWEGCFTVVRQLFYRRHNPHRPFFHLFLFLSPRLSFLAFPSCFCPKVIDELNCARSQAFGVAVLQSEHRWLPQSIVQKCLRPLDSVLMFLGSCKTCWQISRPIMCFM